ncbi:MAG: DUF1801 domain-containing protein [Dehalobacterium sp.]|jgi:hypothetical protein
MSQDNLNKDKKTDKNLDGVAAVVSKIDKFKEPYRTMGKRIHEIIMKTVPELKPRLWYGMPGYAKLKSAPVLLFFRVDDDLITLGLTEKVKFALEENSPHKLMESAWYLHELDDATEEKISSIVRKAVM